MNFNSIEFLIFFGIVLLVHRVLPFKFRWAWLLAASCYFYMSWNPALILLMAITTAVSYGAGRLIHSARSQTQKKIFLTIALVVCLGLLGFFKYFEFLLSSVIAVLNLFSLNLSSPAFNIILPVGISFYTFQTLSYVIDVYRGKVPPEKHFGYYALFVTFFPQLVAGPIESPQNLIPQLRAEKNATSEDMEAGLRLMLYGFFKKIVVADFIGGFVNSAFGDLAANNGLSLWVAVTLFTVQIYCDFSGYSDIASGCARMMGIKLMKNFDQPFLATSFKEYGSRWHISLSRWFMEYVYFPLGGSRKGRVRKYINSFIVFLLSGLWHGAAWTFVAWGALLGLYNVLEDVLRPYYHKLCDKLHIDNKNAMVIFIRRAIMFLLAGLTSVFFRAQSMGDALFIFGKLFTDLGLSEGYFNAALTALSMNFLDLLQLTLALVIVVYAHSMAYPETKKDGLFDGRTLGKSAEATRMTAYFYFIALIAVVWILAVASNDVSAFLYFQF